MEPLSSFIVTSFPANADPAQQLPVSQKGQQTRSLFFASLREMSADIEHATGEHLRPESLIARWLGAGRNSARIGGGHHQSEPT